MTSDAKTVAAYLKELPDDIRRALTKLRAFIRKVALEAKESMKYGMPSYGECCAFARQRNNLALYICDAELVRQFKPKLGKVNCGKGCIRFKKLGDLDMTVVEEMLSARAAKARKQQ